MPNAYRKKQPPRDPSELSAKSRALYERLRAKAVEKMLAEQNQQESQKREVAITPPSSDAGNVSYIGTTPMTVWRTDSTPATSERLSAMWAEAAERLRSRAAKTDQPPASTPQTNPDCAETAQLSTEKSSTATDCAVTAQLSTEKCSTATQTGEKEDDAQLQRTKQTTPAPPLHVRYQGTKTWTELRHELAGLVKGGFTASCTGEGNIFSLKFKNWDDYDAAKAFLEGHHAEKPVPKEEKWGRTIQATIRGLPWIVSTHEVAEEIKQLGFVGAVELRQRTNRGRPPVFLFVGPAWHTKNGEIFTLENILDFEVKIAPTQRDMELRPQCFKCQQYGHTAKHCGNEPACVKCAGAHDSRECRQAKKVPPLCCNCGGEHVASFRGCKVYLQWLQEQLQKPPQRKKRSRRGGKSRRKKKPSAGTEPVVSQETDRAGPPAAAPPLHPSAAGRRGGSGPRRRAPRAEQQHEQYVDSGGRGRLTPKVTPLPAATSTPAAHTPPPATEEEQSRNPVPDEGLVGLLLKRISAIEEVMLLLAQNQPAFNASARWTYTPGEGWDQQRSSPPLEMLNTSRRESTGV